MDIFRRGLQIPGFDYKAKEVEVLFELKSLTGPDQNASRQLLRQLVEHGLGVSLLMADSAYASDRMILALHGGRA